MKLSEKVVAWTRNYLNSFGGNTKVVIGISGGKDSTIVAKICTEAVGPERVVCVRLPQGAQKDLDMARRVCEYIGAPDIECNIACVYVTLQTMLEQQGGFYKIDSTPVFKSNTPARIRMTTLYGIAACIGDCRVANTCNRSETYLGWETKWGDAVGDFAPLKNLTVTEVKQVGRELGIPDEFIDKAPDDGMCGKTDEDKFGFTYAELDNYLLYDIKPAPEVIEKIEKMHKMSAHKRDQTPAFGE